METLKIFGERLRALQDERHLRQADMAEVLQVPLSIIREWNMERSMSHR